MSPATGGMAVAGWKELLMQVHRTTISGRRPENTPTASATAKVHRYEQMIRIGLLQTRDVHLFEPHLVGQLSLSCQCFWRTRQER